jgi:hypothetical protein
MDFEFKADIKRSVEDVFAFFRDLDQFAGRKGSIVPILENITPGPVGLGTRYYEVVQIMPFITGEVFSEIAEFVPNQLISYEYTALGMKGNLTYLFEASSDATKVFQKQSFMPGGILKVLSPIIKAMFSRMAEKRLRSIKDLLENEGASKI